MIDKSANQLYKEYVKECRKNNEKPATWKEWINEQKKIQFADYGEAPVDKQLSGDVKKTLDGLKGVAVSKKGKQIYVVLTITAFLVAGFIFYKNSKTE